MVLKPWAVFCVPDKMNCIGIIEINGKIVRIGEKCKIIVQIGKITKGIWPKVDYKRGQK
jgi:hypothetical protein